MYYKNYFDHQLGGSNAISSGINRVYVGSSYQRGHGIGKFLGGLFRKALPLLSRGTKAIGREALRTGINVLSDIAQAVPLKESVHRRAKESGGNLKRKIEEKFDAYMEGDGYNPKRRMLSPSVLKSLGTVRAAYEARKNSVSKRERKKKKSVVKNRKKSLKTPVSSGKTTTKKNVRKKKKKKVTRAQPDIFD